MSCHSARAFASLGGLSNPTYIFVPQKSVRKHTSWEPQIPNGNLWRFPLMFQKHQAPQVLENIDAHSAGKQAAKFPLCHSKQQLLHVLSDIPLHTFWSHVVVRLQDFFKIVHFCLGVITSFTFLCMIWVIITYTMLLKRIWLSTILKVHGDHHPEKVA